jgi:CRP/FNR family transcriptional regulator, cyclic AMP receptor protein
LTLGRATSHRTGSLLELDPDLGRLLRDKEHRKSAMMSLQVAVLGVRRGEREPDTGAADEPSAIGLMVLEGALACEVELPGAVTVEVLGPGDVLRPCGGDGEVRERCEALMNVELAVIDERLSARLARWPEINAVLIDRLHGRASRLATAQAICQLNGIDRRILAILWLLAERFGHVTPEGVVVALPLNHTKLAQLVGARRPSVTNAIGQLRERGELLRPDDASWLLAGDPIGAPDPATDRVIPIRRRLLGSIARDASLAAPEQDSVVATCRRLRTEAERHRSALHDTLAESTQLAKRLRGSRQR